MTTGPWRAAPTNPDLIQLKSLITSTKGQLRQAVASHVSTLDARIAALGDLRDPSAALAPDCLPAMAEEEARLNARVQTLTSTSDQVRQDYQKARMAEEVEAGDVDIVNLADTPYAPIWPPPRSSSHLGLLLGFLLGPGRRVPSGDNEHLHSPTGGSRARAECPRSGRHSSAHGLGQPAPPVGWSARSRQEGRAGSKEQRSTRWARCLSLSRSALEAFRMLRTSLVWCEQGDNMKTLVITSAAPGEGKTLTAANLSVTFAYDGLRVLLIDCDVRRPDLHGLFQVPRAPGLMELSDPCIQCERCRRFAQLRSRDRANRVRSCCYRRRPAHNGERPLAADLRGLADQRVQSPERRSDAGAAPGAGQELRPSHPGYAAGAGHGRCRNPRSLADGVLLVVRAGQTDRVAAKRAHQQLVNVGARVVGTVLNDPGGEVSQYGDYYYPYDYAVEEQ